MKYRATLEATVEAPSAEAVKNQFSDNNEVIYKSVDVVPVKEWAVTVTVPVYYTFDLTVNAETPGQAEECAIGKLEFIDEIEDFVKREFVADYEYEVDTRSIEVLGVEPIEDEETAVVAA